MPKLDQTEPLWRRLTDHYRRVILAGELATGTQFPSIRDIMREWSTGQTVAQNACEQLRTEGLIHGEPGKRAIVDATRVKPGPSDWILGTAFPPSQRIEIRSAEIFPLDPERQYVATMFPLAPDPDGITRVIRREWVIYDLQNVPFMLCVSWLPPEAARLVPELLDRLELSSLSAAAVIADRTNRTGSAKLHDIWFEARQVRDDGREGPLLRLPKTARVQAVTYINVIGKNVQEYGEFVLLENQKIKIRVGL